MLDRYERFRQGTLTEVQLTLHIKIGCLKMYSLSKILFALARSFPVSKDILD